MMKGQATIEFILLVVVMLLFINTTIVTNANTVSVSALDVSTLGKARLAAEKIVDSINYVGFSGDETKQTVTVFIPEKATIGCFSGDPETTPGKIKFSVDLGGTAIASGCTVNGEGKTICAKDLPVYADLTLECNSGVAAISGPTVVSYVAIKTSTPSPKVTLSFG